MLEWLPQSVVARALIDVPTLYILVSAAHILSIGLLVGAILPLDLRILGVSARVPLGSVGPFLSRSAAFGLTLAIVTGAALFAVRADEYAANPAFLTKIGLLGLGLANALLLHATPAWTVAVETSRASPLAKLSAALSILIWTATVLAGRWIGFV